MNIKIIKQSRYVPSLTLLNASGTPVAKHTSQTVGHDVPDQQNEPKGHVDGMVAPGRDNTKHRLSSMFV